MKNLKESLNSLKGKMSSEKINGIFDKEGFYIVLFLCLCVVATTAVWAVRSYNTSMLRGQSDDFVEFDHEILVGEGALIPGELIIGTPVDVENNEDVAEAKEENEVKEDPVVQKTPVVESTPAIVTNNPIQAQPAINASKITNMIPPVQGKIIKDFSGEELAYWETLGEWRVHEGIDIEAQVGQEVRAAMSGKVVDIINDDMMGITIIIDHGAGLRTKYCNLAIDNMVTKGQSINAGDVISKVGASALAKIADGPLLYFEVIKDGRNIDPKTYLPTLR